MVQREASSRTTCSRTSTSATTSRASSRTPASPSITIRKDKNEVEVNIHTARPGIVIGKSGTEVDALRRELHRMTKKSVRVNILEIKRPELDAKLVAQSIAEQLQNRVAFRRAMKRSLTSAIRSGAKGVKVQVSGRLGGAEMAPHRGLLRRPRAAAHAARGHRLRILRGPHHLRPHRREGVDQQGRDHALRLRAGPHPDGGAAAGRLRRRRRWRRRSRRSRPRRAWPARRSRRRTRRRPWPGGRRRWPRRRSGGAAAVRGEGARRCSPPSA